MLLSERMELLNATQLVAPASRQLRVDQPSAESVGQTRIIQQQQWNHLLIQTHQEPMQVAPVQIKPVPDPQLILLLSGAMRMSLTANGSVRQYSAKPGHLFLTPAHRESYELRWTSLSDQPIRTLHLYLTNSLLLQTAVEVAGVDANRVELRDDSCIVDPLLRQLSYSLGEELDKPEAGSRLFTQMAAQLVAVQLLRQHCTVQHTIPEHGGKLTANQLRQLKDYVLAHLNQPLTLGQLADLVHMSPYHFCRVFKRTVGLSPNQYIIKQRMQRAQELLRRGQDVGQVAYAVGYESQSHFAQLFRRHTGCPPAQYRQVSR